MRCTDDDYEVWMSDHTGCAEFRCNLHEAGCEAYHVLAPLLHRLGLFDSYESYTWILGESLDRQFAGRENASILVAGVASEESARTLVNVLGPTHPARVRFVDRCPTPLCRIVSVLEGDELERITTDVMNLLEDRPAGLENFDVVVADSLMRQFPREHRVRALRNLAGMARWESSLIVFREYFGNTAELLENLWARLPSLPSIQRWLKHADARATATFGRMLPRLKQYMSSVGGSYAEPSEFVSDLRVAGLGVVDMHAIAGKHCKIISCRHLS